MDTIALYIEGCSLLWKSGLLFLESKQLNKLRRHPHYHYRYSIIKSMLWVYFKIESMTAVRLLAKDFNTAEIHSLERFFCVSLEDSTSASLSIWIISACILLRLYLALYARCLHSLICALILFLYSLVKCFSICLFVFKNMCFHLPLGVDKSLELELKRWI